MGVGGGCGCVVVVMRGRGCKGGCSVLRFGGAARRIINEKWAACSLALLPAANSTLSHSFPSLPYYLLAPAAAER